LIHGTVDVNIPRLHLEPTLGARITTPRTEVAREAALHVDEPLVFPAGPLWSDHEEAVFLSMLIFMRDKLPITLRTRIALVPASAMTDKSPFHENKALRPLTCRQKEITTLGRMVDKLPPPRGASIASPRAHIATEAVLHVNIMVGPPAS
jgi:hypothetical protein